MIFKRKDDKINKSKEIIKREKEKIRLEKQKRFYDTALGKKIFKRKKIDDLPIKEQFVSMVYFEILGIILCLLILFVLSGGRNYFKLYYDLRKLINVYDTVTSNYYGDIDKNKMIDSAIESMLNEAGDSYTTYSNKKDTQSFLENMDSTYEGFGCTVATNISNEIYVVSLFENSPAAAAGLQKDDVILKIDGISFEGKTSEDMSNYVKNSKKSKITVVIRRKDEEKELTVNRKKIEIPTVEGKVIDNTEIGYIQINVFSAVTSEQFKKELINLEKEKIKGLIIDVRGNSGGYLSSVTDISSMFLKKGDIIYQLENGSKIEKIKDKTKESRSYPVAVIVNAASASASEILASAMKESYHGLVVGTNTYGKGTVQKTKQLKDGTMIKYTVQKWLTPKGNWINEIGVTPTDFVEYKTATETEVTSDRQLQKAIDLIAEKLK